MSIRGFFKFLKYNHLKKVGEKSVLNIVSGNEAADFDSVASAIAYAYFSFTRDSIQVVIPIINIPRADLSLRRDVVYVLDKLGIDEDLLFFEEDLKLFRTQFEKINSVLVDHNVVSNGIETCIDEVIGIIDHHKDSGLYLDVKPRIVQITGSCSSLVFKYWNDKINNLNVMKEVIPLMLGAVLIDTSNFQYKVETLDLEALEFYKSINPTLENDHYFEELKTAKDNIKNLSIRDVLRKDYKQFTFNKSAKQLTVGIASIVKSLDWLYKEYNGQPNFQADCEKFAIDMKLDIFFIMTAYSEDSDFKRELVAIPTRNNLSLSNQIIEKVTGHLGLNIPNGYSISSIGTQTGETYKSFTQSNILASRKQVAPYLEEAFDSLF